jgi:ABC-2 type transport system ATP-binding protein
MLEVRGLTKRYPGLTAVDNVSFTIPPGEVRGYLGPNGSGKSTTVKMITGLLSPTMGEILFQGRDIKEDLIAYKRRLGYVPEEPFLYAYLTGPEYLQLTGRLRGLPEALLKRKIDGFIELFGLRTNRYSPLSAYSKGMRQKILISAALLHNPDVLIFDEPLSGLDVTAALVFRDLVKQLAEEGKTILFSSHVMEVVERICTHVTILHRGKVVAHDSVAALRGLMHLPSLEEIFAQLVMQDDPGRTAADMVAVMRL